MCLLGIARWRPRAARPHAEDVLEDVESLHEQGFLLLAAREKEGLLVQIAVVTDLVAAPQRLARHVRVALDDPARDEEAHLHVVAVEHAQDPWHGGLRAVGAHAHVQRPLGERGVPMDPRALAVHVERERHRAPRPVLPLDRSVHDCLHFPGGARPATRPPRPAASPCTRAHPRAGSRARCARRCRESAEAPPRR